METKLVIVDDYVQVVGKSLEEIRSHWEGIVNNGEATLDYVEDVEYHGFNLYEVPAEIAKDLNSDSLDKINEHGTFIREVKIYFPDMPTAA